MGLTGRSFSNSDRNLGTSSCGMGGRNTDIDITSHSSNCRTSCRKNHLPCRSVSFLCVLLLCRSDPSLVPNTSYTQSLVRQNAGVLEPELGPPSSLGEVPGKEINFINLVVISAYRVFGCLYVPFTFSKENCRGEGKSNQRVQSKDTAESLKFTLLPVTSKNKKDNCVL